MFSMIFLRIFLLSFLLASVTALASEQNPPTAPRMEVRRVALLTAEPSTDKRVQQVLQEIRERKTNMKQRSSLLRLLFTPPEKRPSKPASRANTKAPIDPNALNNEQLRQIGEALFTDALRERLQKRSSLQLVSIQDVAEARAKVGRVSDSQLVMKRLQEILDCDVVLDPNALGVRLQEDAVRSVLFWGSVVCYEIMAEGDGTFRDVFGSGAGKCNKAPFNDGYLKPVPMLLTQGADGAAAMAANAFITRLDAPFALRGETVAFVPIPAPQQVDGLLFASEGRRLIKAVFQNLPTDISSHFRPDILPARTLDATRVSSSLQGMGWNVESLWKSPTQTDKARLKELGAKLGATYVMAVRISFVEAELRNNPNANPPYHADAARAEAVGMMLRVADGMVLWEERVQATMEGRFSDTRRDGAKRVVQDAERFALLELQRRFAKYRNSWNGE